MRTWLLLIGVVLYFVIGQWLSVKVSSKLKQTNCHEAFLGIMGGLILVVWPVVYPLYWFKDRKEIEKEIKEIKEREQHQK